jgi:hypothetical protein
MRREVKHKNLDEFHAKQAEHSGQSKIKLSLKWAAVMTNGAQERLKAKPKICYSDGIGNCW